MIQVVKKTDDVNELIVDHEFKIQDLIVLWLYNHDCHDVNITLVLICCNLALIYFVLFCCDHAI